MNFFFFYSMLETVYPKLKIGFTVKEGTTPTGEIFLKGSNI